MQILLFTWVRKGCICSGGCIPGPWDCVHLLWQRLPPQPRHSPVTQADLDGAYWGFVSSSRTFRNCPEAWWDQHASFISLKVVLISITSFPGM